MVGFELSPVLWRKVRPSLSAGRVQSVAVRLIVEKEKEIGLFNSESFYRINGVFESEKGKIQAEVSKKMTKESDVVSFLESCMSSSFSIDDVVKKPAIKKPTAPFTTSTLQQEASLKLGFSVSRTMSVAQRLYEAGHITYMRTDSVNLSETALDGAQKEIEKAYGKEFSNRKKFTTKNAGAQEAHEAIRPTDFSKHSVNGESEQVKLYDLIWKRAISSQMSDAQLERTTIKIEGIGVSEIFQAKGEVIIFEGFLKVYLESTLEEDEEDVFADLLPAVQKGESVSRKIIKATQRFSRPPARYIEASLVKKLESLGIGRPSTYAPTISTIQKRGYVEKPLKEGTERKFDQFVLEGSDLNKNELSEITGKEKNKLSPTDIGIVVTDFLTEHFSRIMDYNFTAQVEKEFDEIAKGLVQWTKMIKDFSSPFHKNVVHTLEHSERASGEREIGIDRESG